jgi:hypothetical protein
LNVKGRRGWKLGLLDLEKKMKPNKKKGRKLIFTLENMVFVITALVITIMTP